MEHGQFRASANVLSNRAETSMTSHLTPSSRQRSSVYLGVFLVSSSALMMELILTRIFSVKLYYHYAFMVISLALLGSGGRSVRRRERRTDRDRGFVMTP